jgi:hypothetical protein
MKTWSFRTMLTALQVLARRPGTPSQRVTMFMKSVTEIIIETRYGHEMGMAYILANQVVELFPDRELRQQQFMVEGINGLLTEEGWIYELIRDAKAIRTIK